MSSVSIQHTQVGGQDSLVFLNSSKKLVGFPVLVRGLAVSGCGVRRGTHRAACVHAWKLRSSHQKRPFQLWSTAAAWPEVCLASVGHCFLTLVKISPVFVAYTVRSSQFILSENFQYTFFFPILGGGNAGEWTLASHRVRSGTETHPYLVHGILHKLKFLGNKLIDRADALGSIPSTLHPILAHKNLLK